MKRFVINLSLLLLLFAHESSSQEVVRFNTGPNATAKSADNFIKKRYPVGLLDIALANTVEEYGPYTLKPSKVGYKRSRAMRFLTQGQNIDVMWGKEGGFVDSGLIPIRIPIFRQAANYRVFVIRKDDRQKFENIQNEKQLQQMKLGVTRHSHLVKPLKKLGYKVVNSAQSTDRLRKMLRHKRFDYISVPANATTGFIHENPDLIVSERLAWQFPQEYYFYVHPDNEKLYQRIKLGLEKAEQSGEFKQFFDNHRGTASYRALQNNEQRLVFKLDINN